MSGNKLLRSLALLLVAVSFSSIRLAAQDAPSVAEAARRAREQKQTAAKPAHVITDDTLTPIPSGATPPSTSNSAPRPENAASAPAFNPEADADAEALRKKKVETLKQQIAEKKQSIDLLQRELTLAQDAFYSNPDHEHDKAGKQRLDSMQSDVKQQQAEIAELQAQLTDVAGPLDTKTPEPSKP